MGCCNGDCLGSVQLVQGPDGPPGNDGAAGTPAAPELLSIDTATDVVTIATTGSSTIDLTYLRPLISTSVTEQTQTSSSYGANHIDVTIPANTLVNDGEFVRLNFAIIGDYEEDYETDLSAADKYDYKISLSTGATILDTSTYGGGISNFRLIKQSIAERNACQMTIDLIRTGATQLTPVIRNADFFRGDRALRMIQTSIRKSLSPTFVVLSPVTVTLSGAFNLRLQTKSTDNTSTVGVQFHEVSKFIKPQ